MPTFARRLSWLQKVFPPAGGNEPIPTEYSNDIVLTHRSIPPSAAFDELRSAYFLAASVDSVSSGIVPSGKFWWVQACSGWHNTGVGRQDMRIMVHAIHGAVVAQLAVCVASQEDVTSSGGGQVQFQVNGKFIVPPGGKISCHLTTATAGTGPVLQFQFLELPLGQEIW